MCVVYLYVSMHIQHGYSKVFLIELVLTDSCYNQTKAYSYYVSAIFAYKNIIQCNKPEKSIVTHETTYVPINKLLSAHYYLFT